MKTFMIISAFIFLTACDQGRLSQAEPALNAPAVSVSPAPPAEPEKTSEIECKICDFDFAGYKGDLEKEEIDGLLLALNDEYYAFATYEQVNKDFENPRPFVNIQRSETQHVERLKKVFIIHKVPVPENRWLGNTTKFQSVAEACQAGVKGEIVNRDLYEKLFETTKRNDILLIYRALQRASEENHLPAFERCGKESARNFFVKVNL